MDGVKNAPSQRARRRRPGRGMVDVLDVAHGCPVIADHRAPQEFVAEGGDSRTGRRQYQMWLVGRGHSIRKISGRNQVMGFWIVGMRESACQGLLGELVSPPEVAPRGRRLTVGSTCRTSRRFIRHRRGGRPSRRVSAGLGASATDWVRAGRRLSGDHVAASPDTGVGR